MTVTTQKSTEYAARVDSGTVQYPTEYGGEFRSQLFTHDQSGAGEATSSVIIGYLPPGRVRLMLANSWAYVNWTTASATLDLGWDAYTGLDGVAVLADPDGLVDGMDVDTVGIRQFSTSAAAGPKAAGYTKLFESKDGVIIRATSQDTAIASGDDLVGALVYVMAD